MTLALDRDALRTGRKARECLNDHFRTINVPRLGCTWRRSGFQALVTKEASGAAELGMERVGEQLAVAAVVVNGGEETHF